MDSILAEPGNGPSLNGPPGKSKQSHLLQHPSTAWDSPKFWSCVLELSSAPWLRSGRVPCIYARWPCLLTESPQRFLIEGHSASASPFICFFRWDSLNRNFPRVQWCEFVKVFVSPYTGQPAHRRVVTGDALDFELVLSVCDHTFLGDCHWGSYQTGGDAVFVIGVTALHMAL